MRAIDLSALGIAVALCACTGDIGGNADDPPIDLPPQSAVVGRTGTADEICGELGIQAARSPFRRLRRDEYNNTVEYLFGDTSGPADRFPVTSSEAVGFEVTVSPVQYELYASASRDIADAVDLDALFDCSDADSACADRFIEEIGLRVWRRPVSADAAARLRVVYDVGAATDHERGLRLVLSAMLQSPNFLYLGEVARPDGASPDDVVALDDFERASRLSYLIWQSTPDDELLAAAGAGELSSVEQVREQVLRMMEDERARETVLAFNRAWLHLDMDGVNLNGFDESVVRAMERETELFIEHVLFDSTGTLEELMTADYSFINAELAEIYGVEWDAEETGFVRTDLNPEQRSGVLTHGSFLAHTASEGSAAPVFRGKFVTEQFLCRLLPEPPDDIPPFSASGTEADTLRERLSVHRENPSCAGCHRLMDPIGFGFENYDSVGRYRDETALGPVDNAGELRGTVDSDGEFAGAVELTDRLSNSEDLRQCMSTQWLRFGMRRLEGDNDLCSLRRMDEVFAGSEYDLLSLVVALSQTDAFLYRRVGALTEPEDSP